MDATTKCFWAGCAEGEIRYQHCPACDSAQFFPRPFCAKCGHGAPAWRASAGLGTVYSLTRIVRAPTPEYRALAPYSILLVDLDEGVRIMAHGADGLAIGDRVTARFRVLGELSLPIFQQA
jgi:hypothetical protein